MRTCVLIAWLALLSACKSPAPEAANEVARETPKVQPRNSVEEEIGDNVQAVEAMLEAKVHPCLTQDGEAVTHKLKAIGTEPFWAAEVEGRCVTYKTPEDQRGTRIWTHVDTGPQGPVWNGTLRGEQFQLIVKPAPPPGCFDGMSDKTYPMDAILRVDGETRNGCADQL